MLQRAASNAYSWWWASHVRTKQSKWLEQSLQDMGDKVETVLKLITQDGDSFAKRAEMYYKHRPELINFVEESFRAYQSLAERYDHISKELQNANSTLAAAFPDQFQYQLDDDDDFSSPRVPRKFQMEIPQNLNIPKAPPKFPTKNIKAIMALTNSKKTSFENTSNSTDHGNKVPISGLTKSEALTEIDKLQKQILTLQTEKEFAKSSYESGHAKYWDIEEEITGMQERISKLQDEFGISKAIEDDEARTLMAEAAIKSCKDTLSRLQEKQERGVQEVEAERRRINDARDRLRYLKGELKHDEQTNVSENGEYSNLEENLAEQRDLEMFRDEIKEHFDANATDTLTVSEMAERIDELVNKVITLETAVSSQSALIHTLRSETDELQSQIKNLEDDKANLIEGKNDLTHKVSEMENKLKGLHELDRNLQQHNNNLKTHFMEAHSNLDTISKKLHNMEPDEEFEKTSCQLQENGRIAVVEEVNKTLVDDITEKESNPLIVNQNQNEDGIMQPFESPIPSTMNNPHDSSLQESKLITNQAIETFNSDVEKQVNPQGTQQLASTLSRNESTSPQVLQSKDIPNNITGEPINTQDVQQKPLTLSTIDSVISQEVQSREAGNGQGEDLISTQGTQRPATLHEQEFAIGKEIPLEETQNNYVEEPINTSGTLQKPPTTPRIEVVIPEEVESKTILNTKVEEPMNTEGTQEHLISLGGIESVIPQEVQSEEKPCTKSEEPLIAEGTPQQPVTMPTNKHVSPRFHKIEPIVPKDELVILEDVLRKELTDGLNDGSDNYSFGHRHGHLIKNDDSEPNWQELFMNRLDGKEKVILMEYTNTLRNYKEAKKRIGELEKKCQIDISGIEAQLRELKDNNAMKDEENHSLRQKLNALQRRLEEYKNEKEEKNVSFEGNDVPLPSFEDEEDIGVAHVEGHGISPAEEKLRADIDEILEENLNFWMRFSASFGQIQKFQNGVQDLFSELSKVENNKEMKEGSSHGTGNTSFISEIRPIYKHLREIKTELAVWLDHNEKLKDELQKRFSQLCNIQEAIKHAVNAGAADDDMKFTSYNAAKFQGEVANMQQENNKVGDEIQAGMDHITSLLVEVERRLSRLNEELGFYGTKSQNENQMRSGSKGRVPLKSFIFGVKQEKKKQSIFWRMQPAMKHRRYQQLKDDKSP